MVMIDHHGDGRFAIRCAAPAGLQEMLVEADPERFFRPFQRGRAGEAGAASITASQATTPWIGHRGRLGVRLDRGVHWDELEGIVEDAYAEVAPAHLVESLRRAD